MYKDKKCIDCDKLMVNVYHRVNLCYECKIQRKREQDKRYREKNKEVLKIKKKEQRNLGKERECIVCHKIFNKPDWLKDKFCSRDCFYKEQKTARLGKKNPAYRNGTRIKGVNISAKHLFECRKYRKQFLKKHDYLFCEHCKINQNGTPRFEVHHIYFASRVPRHKELHNHKNMILLCIQCHNNFHAGKKFEKEFKILEKTRGLDKLFS